MYAHIIIYFIWWTHSSGFCIHIISFLRMKKANNSDDEQRKGEMMTIMRSHSALSSVIDIINIQTQQVQVDLWGSAGFPLRTNVVPTTAHKKLYEKFRKGESLLSFLLSIFIFQFSFSAKTHSIFDFSTPIGSEAQIHSRMGSSSLHNIAIYSERIHANMQSIQRLSF